MKLVNSLVRHFAKAFSTLLSVTFQVVAPSCDAFRFFSSVLTSVSLLISFEQLLYFPSKYCYSLLLLVEYIHEKKNLIKH